MLSILIGLACVAIIVAFADQLLLGLLFIGVIALRLISVAIALFVLFVVANHIEKISPLLFTIAVVALCYICVRYWRNFSSAFGRFRPVFTERVRGIADPKKWSPRGTCILSAWMFAVPFGSILLLSNLLDDGYEMDSWAIFGILGWLSICLAILGFGTIWYTITWLRTPGKRLRDYGTCIFLIGCALMPVGAAPQAIAFFGIGFLLVIIGFALIAVDDVRKQSRTEGQK
ncbi:hypothetical protein [Henriciella aquimarina]|uniref:hypothetical protein n=1 Tax=Henriciella aquimarina TaxID=545261 RepID=UPI000A05BD3C|nr:hypothetical protein [Henriciella aquimarina]